MGGKYIGDWSTRFCWNWATEVRGRVYTLPESIKLDNLPTLVYVVTAIFVDLKIAAKNIKY